MNRVVDLVFGLGGSAAFAPAQTVIAALLVWEDGPPVLFTQERVGRGRVPFRIYKLRTMRDGQVTRVGRWLRGTGLDESLQFWNVLRGDMSFVGPRPLTEDDIVRLGYDVAGKDQRFSVKPGITGLAQVVGGRSARHTRALDALYARRASLRLDVELVAISFAMNLFGKKRVRGWLFERRPSAATGAATASTR